MHVVKVTKKQNIIVNDGFRQFKARAVPRCNCTGCILRTASTRDTNVCYDVPCLVGDRNDVTSVIFVERQ